MATTGDYFPIGDEETGPDLIDLSEIELDDELKYEERDPNLVRSFERSAQGRLALRSIAEEIKSVFDEEWARQKGERDMFAEMYKLYTGKLDPKTRPGTDMEMQMAHVPLLLENVGRLSARMLSEVFGDWQNFYGVIPNGADDEIPAQILSKHGNMQLGEWSSDFRRQMERSMFMFLMLDVVAYSHYDEMRRENMHEVLTKEQYLLPYMYCSTTVDFSDVPWRIKVLEKYRYELEAMRPRWENVDKVLEQMADSDSELDQPLRVTVNEVEEKDDPSPALGSSEAMGIGAAYKLIQYEGWLELPNQEDMRFCQCIIDNATLQVLSLRIYEEDDAKDRERHDRQLIELEQYIQARQAYELNQTTQRLSVITVGDQYLEGKVTDKGTAAAGAMQMSAPEAPPPQPPEWLENPQDYLNAKPEKVRRVPISMWSHGVCVEPIVGSGGFGPGLNLMYHNKAGNALLTGFIDSADIANNWGIATTEDVQWKDGEFVLAPGYVNVARGIGGEDLANKIREFKPGPANPQLFEMVRTIEQWAQKAAQAPDVLSGTPGKSGEPYKALASRIEQATKSLSTMASKYANGFLKQILKNNARLNAHFMQGDDFIRLFNDKLRDEQWIPFLSAGRRLYQRSFSFRITSDLKFTSEVEKGMKAQNLVMFLMQNPILQKNQPLMYQAFKQFFEDSGFDEFIPYLGKELPPPENMLGQSLEQMQQAAMQAQMAAQQGPPPGQGGPPGAPPPA